MEQRNEWRRQLIVLITSFLAGLVWTASIEDKVGWGIVNLITRFTIDAYPEFYSHDSDLDRLRGVRQAGP